MPGENLQDWSVTATDNGNSDSLINWSEGQARASVNNSSRSEMAAHAKDRNLKNGSIVTGGVVNALTFLSGLSYTATPVGLRVKLKIAAGLTNTGAATLNMDGIGAAPVKDALGNAVQARALLENTYADFLWDGTNWRLLANYKAGTPPDALANVRKFLASGTYPTTTAATKVLVYCKGGGGGGAQSLTIGPLGGGGGEGGEAWLLTTAAALSGLGVVVGAGGVQGVDGSAGEATTVGGIAGAFGGGGGTRGNFGGVGGIGGAVGSSPDLVGMPGACGQTGADTSGTIGIYSSGGGKGGGRLGANGVPNSGGGGAGVTFGSAAGNGGSGIVIFYEYGLI